MKTVVRISLLSLVLAFGVLLAGCTKSIPNGKYDAFAQCLTEKGVKMYGAYWCSHCKEQKEMFGDSMSKATYIECAVQGSSAVSQVCKVAGVESYPTWVFSDNSRLVGTQSLEVLAAKSGCSLDANTTNTVNTQNTNSETSENSNQTTGDSNTNTQ